jgi:hypothetical protein
VLFVGYGMSEFELIDFLIHKTNSTSKITESELELRHFILLPYYRDEINIRDFHQHYYKHLGIKTLGYQKDYRGYAQLYEVIKDWNKQIEKTTNILPEDFQEIDNFVDNL